MSRVLDAKAVTLGSSIYFAREAYDPNTEASRELINHRSERPLGAGGYATPSGGPPATITPELARRSARATTSPPKNVRCDRRRIAVHEPRNIDLGALDEAEYQSLLTRTSPRLPCRSQRAQESRRSK